VKLTDKKIKIKKSYLKLQFTAKNKVIYFYNAPKFIFKKIRPLKLNKDMNNHFI